MILLALLFIVLCGVDQVEVDESEPHRLFAYVEFCGELGDCDALANGLMCCDEVDKSVPNPVGWHEKCCGEAVGFAFLGVGACRGFPVAEAQSCPSVKIGVGVVKFGVADFVGNGETLSVVVVVFIDDDDGGVASAIEHP